MKTLRFFGMMLMAVMVSFSMTACGDDDDDEEGGGGGFGGGSYAGEWVVENDNFPNYPSEIGVLTLTSNTWTVRYYYAEDAQNIHKFSASGKLSVSGSTMKVSGEDLRFAEGTWSVTGNTMKLTYVDDEDGKKYTDTYTRLTSEQSKILAAWDKIAKTENFK